MKKVLLCIVATVMICSVVSDADAWPFRRRTRGYSSSGGSAGYNLSDQAVAQAKANAMANMGRYSHGAGGYRLAGSFEGVGCGTSRNCSTCTPRGGMRLVADAAAYSSRTGLWYRCRGWR